MSFRKEGYENMTKTKTRTMTITDMARVCGVAVSSISALVSKWELKPVKTGQHNAKYYSVEDTVRILDYYQSKTNTDTKTSTRPTQSDMLESMQRLVDQQTAEIEILRHQLDVKDKQIEVLQQLVDQAQKLDLTTHAQSDTKLLETKTKTEQSPSDDNHGFFYKLFH